MDGETTGIIISAGTVSSICTLIGLWIKAKFGQKVKVTRPVDSGDVFVTRCECEQHRLAITKRIDELGPALNRIFLKLDENNKASEDRANAMHRRIDPMIERTAANTQAIEMFKDFARAYTVGGKK